IAQTRVSAHAELVRGWAIPCATDIAFSYLIATALFPRRHPAIAFLLLLAIADDALGLVILALFYPAGKVAVGLFVIILAVSIAIAATLRYFHHQNFWTYLATAGVVSWFAFFLGGFHPALALVPVVPFMPSKPHDFGLYAPTKSTRADALADFHQWWRTPVQAILLLFGFANAGVRLSSTGPGTWFVLIALLAGKPLGILAF